jgi:hypothetical protein
LGGGSYQDKCPLPKRLYITGLRLRLSGQVFPAHQATHYRLAVAAIRTSVPCPPDYTLQPCSWSYQDKCSLPKRLYITGLRLGLSGLVFPYMLPACGWSNQDKRSLPKRLYITGLRLGLSGPMFPFILQACVWSYQDKCSLPTTLHITGLRLGLSGLMFPYITQACGWSYQEKCSLSKRLYITGLRLRLSEQVLRPSSLYFIFEACDCGCEDKCSRPLDCIPGPLHRYTQRYLWGRE